MTATEFTDALTANGFRFARKCKCAGSPGRVYTETGGGKLQIRHMYIKNVFTVSFRNYQLTKQTSIDTITAASLAEQIANHRTNGLASAKNIFRHPVA